MKNAKQILSEEIDKEQVKLLLPMEREIKSHNGISYVMVNEEIAIRAMEIYADQIKHKKERRSKERYFIVSYTCDYINGGVGGGFTYFKNIGFPSYNLILDIVRKKFPQVKSISISNIKELCKVDYENFISDN